MAKAAKKKKTIRSIPQLRTPVRELDPQVRVKNFEEVNCGYSLDEALNESERCLMCPDPACIAGCPVNINIPKFIEALTAKDVRGAYDVITASNLLASGCGRVCPQETQCEGVCKSAKRSDRSRSAAWNALSATPLSRRSGATSRTSSRPGTRSALSVRG